MRQVIYFGGSILPMEGTATPEALLTCGGKIAALGSLAELKAQAPWAERVDLEGKALLPAFLDPHSHLTALAATLELCQLGAADSFEAIGEDLKAYVEENGLEPESWAMGFSYDHNTLRERAHPTREVLDRYFPRRPVLITHTSGHMGVLNTAALQACGITASTPDPVGGKIGREPDGRVPNGYLEENAFRAASAKAPLRERDGISQLERAQQIYFSHGITVLQDGATGSREYQTLSAAAERGRLKANVVGYIDQEKAPELSRSPYWQREQNHFKLGGYKIFLDGSPQGRTAWMLEPYQGGDAADTGYPIHDDKTVTGFVRAALEEGVQILAHCNGDAATAQYIRCCRAAQAQVGRPIRSIRPVMIHAQLVRPEQLAEMAQLGIIPSFFAAHLWYWGDVHVENFGPRRAAAISPLSEAVRLGLPFTLHQDTPVIQPDMLESVWCAANRITRSGMVLGPDYRVSAYETLKAVTVHAAYQYGMEDSRGSLRVGKVADLVILDRDPTAVPREEIRGIQVMETIKDGQTVYRTSD